MIISGIMIPEYFFLGEVLIPGREDEELELKDKHKIKIIWGSTHTGA